MANALQGGAPPEAPMPAQSATQPGPAQLTGPQQAPVLSHAQTVAALHHFDAIQKEIEGLLKSPEVGRSSIKSAIIDGATSLVANRIISPAQAVQQLGTVPDDPLEQRKWLRKQLEQTVQAENIVLAHRSASTQGGSAPEEDHAAQYDPDTHIDTMVGVHSQYKGLNRG